MLRKLLALLLVLFALALPGLDLLGDLQSLAPGALHGAAPAHQPPLTVADGRELADSGLESADSVALAGALLEEARLDLDAGFSAVPQKVSRIHKLNCIFLI
ncbi:MAG TPA: hypothetical protein VNL14_01435 [Candidatus Acidoferrales bacterium]|nr:hypothetical protein [Candidatus Acidoferrales bacterium]